MNGAAPLLPLLLGADVPETIRVGVETAPPFVVQTEGGEWEGISLRLWRDLAEDRGWKYEVFESLERDLDDLVAQGEVDVGIGAFTLSPDGEAAFDYSHAYLHAGLAVATARRSGSDLSRGLAVLAEPRVTRTTLGIAVVVGLVGLLIWLMERGREPKDRTIVSLEDGFWWSVVTMTTVGYGDTTPQTRAGRFFAAAWMLVSLVLLSVFTAVLASAFTAAELAQVDGPEDLHRARVGTVDDSNGASYLSRLGIRSRSYPFLLHALRALRRDELDAVVYDAPTLRYVLDDFGWHDLELGRS
ncbi:MAG: transporter substrate-binding domain-containing protein, partial [Myxococcota bacterium]